MERTQSVAPGSVPTATSKMSKELQDTLPWNDNLWLKTDEELRVLWEAVNSHIQRLEEEIPLTSDDAARQQKIIDKRALKEYKQGIRETKYEKKHPVPSRKDVYWQVVKAYHIMSNFQDSLKADRKDFEANTLIDAEERQMHVTAVNADIKEVKKHTRTLFNMMDHFHEE